MPSAAAASSVARWAARRWSAPTAPKAACRAAWWASSRSRPSGTKPGRSADARDAVEQGGGDGRRVDVDPGQVGRPVADDGVQVVRGSSPRPSGQPVSSQPVPSTMPSACAARSRRRTRRRRQGSTLEWRSRPVSARPVAVACTWASTKAGVSSAPSPAIVRSAAGASAASPSQAIRPSTTCTARPGRSPTVTSVTQQAHAVDARVDERAHARRRRGTGRGPGRRAPACSRCRPASSRPPPSPPRPGPPPRTTWPWRRRPRCPRRPSPGSAPCSAPGHVDADDGDVGRRADRRGDRERVGGVGDDDPVGQARRRAARRPPPRCAPAPVSSVGPGGPGRGEDEAAGLAGRAQDDDRARRRPARPPGRWRRGRRRRRAPRARRRRAGRRAGRRRSSGRRGSPSPRPAPARTGRPSGPARR